MTLPEVNELYAPDERCRELLTRLRWPNGIECPRCKDRRISTLKEYDRFECAKCEYQFTVTSGTVFHDSHLPLSKWFLAVLLLVEARKGMSASQLKRTLFGLHKGSYKTAWYLCHRIRHAMVEAQNNKLDGVVEIDETYVGGKERVDRKFKNKEIVIGLRQRGGQLRFLHVNEVNMGTIHDIALKHVDKDVEFLMTDESRLYNFDLTKFEGKHKRIKHKERYVDGNIHTNTVENAFSLLKRGIIGTWHRISAKHLPAYLREMEFRFNRRKRSDLFLDTLRHMVTADPLTFEKLTA